MISYSDILETIYTRKLSLIQLEGLRSAVDEEIVIQERMYEEDCLNGEIQ